MDTLKAFGALPIALILFIGMALGSIFGPVPAADAPSHISTSATPVPVPTSIITRTVDILPKPCLDSFKQAELGFLYSSTRAQLYKEALSSLHSYDWYEASVAMKSIKKINTRMTKLYPSYLEARALCQHITQ